MDTVASSVAALTLASTSSSMGMQTGMETGMEKAEGSVKAEGKEEEEEEKEKEVKEVKIEDELRIDMHTHILPRQWPDLARKYGYAGWTSLQVDDPCACYKSYGGTDLQGVGTMLVDGKPFRSVQSTTWSPEDRMRDCDNTKVTVQVLSTVPVMFSYWAKPEDALDLARYLNDHIAQVVGENPKRFIGLGTLPMQDPDLAIKELRRCMQDLRLSGIQIGTSINDWSLDAPELFPIFQACEELDAVVFIHPWDMKTEGRFGKYWFPWLVGMPCETTMAICSLIFGGVLERLPKLKICLAHGGGSFPATIGRIEHGFLTRPDLCAINTKVPPSAYLGRIWVDSLVHDVDALDLLLKKMGEDRVVLGSDYPFILGEHRPGDLVVGAPALTDAVKRKILVDNALKMFGLTRDQFLP